MTDVQEKVKDISSYTSKLLRKKFGRGPESCMATLSEKFLLLHIRGFVSPMEEVLLLQGKYQDVDNARTVIIANVLEELKGVVQVSLNVEVTEFYHDWNFPNNTGVIILILSGNCPQLSVGKSAIIPKFEKEIARISELVQKVPDEIVTIIHSEKVIVVKRDGILIPIEKALIKRGFEKELIITKDELEKEYFHRFGKFGDILSCKVKDIFIDWDLKEDKSLMVFILQ
ncbi:Na-translocating system protein MpsC family protein [Halalkalibacter kiskunsagensis]|uniref:Na-translocating system protein MpsC family protein n=1 Tax=Halalkalibacter kiskunsagensis TaxID=1548599 RepID=A0ABV6KCT4_9BACI